jgi:hypothetical protein
MDFLFADEYPLGAAINHERPNVLGFVLVATSFWSGAAGHGADSGDELAHAEGLAEVVVSAKLKSHDAVNFVVSGTHHDDRDARSGTNLSANVVAVAVRQTEVEEHDVWRVGAKGVLRTLVSGGDMVNFKAG